MLCSLEHGSKDQGKDGVCLLPPVLISLSAGDLAGIVQIKGLEITAEDNGSSWLEHLRLSAVRVLSRPCLWNGATQTGAASLCPP